MPPGPPAAAGSPPAAGRSPPPSTTEAGGPGANIAAPEVPALALRTRGACSGSGGGEERIALPRREDGNQNSSDKPRRERQRPSVVSQLTLAPGVLLSGGAKRSAAPRCAPADPRLGSRQPFASGACLFRCKPPPQGRSLPLWWGVPRPQGTT